MLEIFKNPAYDVCPGAPSLANREISLTVLAALLTVIGFSVNDRIVMYDRLREIKAQRTRTELSFAEQVNLAVNQTLSRTVLTVATVAMSAAMLLWFGGGSLENFGFVVLIGALTGTTSTVYVAGALDVDWSAWADRHRGKCSGSAGPKVRLVALRCDCPQTRASDGRSVSRDHTGRARPSVVRQRRSAARSRSGRRRDA